VLNLLKCPPPVISVDGSLLLQKIDDVYLAGWHVYDE
jgi:hypothetical protein